MPRCPQNPGRRSPARPCSSGTEHRHAPECRRGCSCRTERRSDSRPPPSLSRVTPSAVSEHFSELLGCPISRSFTACCVCLELRPLPSPGITRLQRYYGPLRHPSAPSLSLAGVRLIIPDHAVGLPVLRALSLCTCRRHYPGAADGRTRRSKSPTRVSLPRFHYRVGLHTTGVISVWFSHRERQVAFGRPIPKERPGAGYGNAGSGTKPPLSAAKSRANAIKRSARRGPMRCRPAGRLSPVTPIGAVVADRFDWRPATNTCGAFGTDLPWSLSGFTGRSLAAPEHLPLNKKTWRALLAAVPSPLSGSRVPRRVSPICPHRPHLSWRHRRRSTSSQLASTRAFSEVSSVPSHPPPRAPMRTSGPCVHEKRALVER